MSVPFSLWNESTNSFSQIRPTEHTAQCKRACLSDPSAGESQQSPLEGSEKCEFLVFSSKVIKFFFLNPIMPVGSFQRSRSLFRWSVQHVPVVARRFSGDFLGSLQGVTGGFHNVFPRVPATFFGGLRNVFCNSLQNNGFAGMPHRISEVSATPFREMFVKISGISARKF